MLGLIIRELQFLKTLIVPFFIFIILLIGLGAFLDQYDIAIFMLIYFSGAIALASRADDEESNWDLFSRSLPIHRGSVVGIKYTLTIFTIATCSIVAHYVTKVTLNFLGKPVTPHYWYTVLIYATIATLSTAIWFPIMYKKTYRKIKYWFIAIAIALGILNGLGSKHLIPTIQANFTVQVFAIIVASTGLIALLISFFVSYRINQKK